MYIHNT